MKRRLHRPRRSASGFTLVEMIMVIVITGVIAGMVAVFIQHPVRGYFDTVRRAELTDQADVSLRRMLRDVRLALPNSLRVMETNGATTNTGTCGTAGFTCYIEFIMTQSGGRYRDSTDGSTGGDFLSYTSSADVSFDVLGPTPTMAAGDYVVVYNLGSQPADAYNYDTTANACRTGGCNVAKITTAGANVTLAANPFASQMPPLPSPSARFQVVPAAQQAVTYSCGTTVAGNLNRFAAYGFNSAQSVPSGTPAVLAAGATCRATYTANATGRNGLLFISLTLAADDEQVTLFNQVHVDNTP